MLRFQLRRRERPAWDGDAGRDEEDMIAGPGDAARDCGTFQALLSLMRPALPAALRLQEY